MKIVIPGGRGELGRVLVGAFRARGDEVVVLSRGSAGAFEGARVVCWDGRTLGPWTAEVDGADAVVNLAGRSVDCRYTWRNLNEMMDSRIDSTRVLGEAIARAARPPRVWLQSSTATIYAHRFDAPNDEATGVIGGREPGVPGYWRASIDIATSWERTLAEAATPHTRKVAMRTAMVMIGHRSGTFDIMLRLVRFGAGGAIGGGRQYMSWIHEQDFARAVIWLLEREDIAGAVNVAAPGPLTQREFMRTLRSEWGRRFAIGAPAWLFEVATFLHRTESELILKSRRVVPQRLEGAGFRFDFPSWPEAARDLVARWKAA